MHSRKGFPFPNKLRKTLKLCVVVAHMFTRSSRGATRCLRCQFRLLSPRPRPSQLHYARPIPSPQRFLSTSTDAPEETPGRSDEGPGDTEDNSNSLITYVTWPDIGQTSSLGIESLGEPGNVFLLKDNEIRRKDNPDGAILDDTIAREWSDPSVLKQMIDEEGELSDSSYAKNNLERIRLTRQHCGPLQKKKWDDLRATITSGFTITQLSDYIQDFQNEPIQTDDPTWRPGTSVFLDSEAGKNLVNKVTGLKSPTLKQLLAEKILRGCWKHEIVGETGQLHLRFKPLEISMLLNTEYGPLKEFAETHRVKIDVSRSLNLVSVTGDRSSCENVQGPIRDFLSDIHSTTMNISPHNSIFVGKDRRVDDEFLAWLGDQYGVACEQQKAKQTEINIAYLPGNGEGAEQARRGIGLGLASRRCPPSPFRALATTSDEPVLSPVITPDSMSWLNRRNEWFRWGKTTEEWDSVTPVEIHNTVNDDCRDSINRFLVNKNAIKSKHFSKGGHISESITATVGKCLLSSPKLSPGPVRVGTLDKMSSRRIFTNEVPAARSFLGELKPLREDTGRTSHRIRLLPSPASAHQPPPVELELDISVSDSGPKSSITRAIAVLHEKDIDLLLPHNTLDLRFTRNLTYDLLPEGFPTHQHENITLTSLLKCVEDLRYSFPITQTQPAVPPFCRLTIPKMLLSGEVEGSSNPTKIAEIDEMVEVEYMLPQLKTILGSRLEAYDYRDETLEFSHSISGPVLASETTNLSLRMKEVPKNHHKKHFKRTFERFYDHAYILAFKLGAMKGEDTI